MGSMGIDSIFMAMFFRGGNRRYSGKPEKKRIPFWWKSNITFVLINTTEIIAKFKFYVNVVS